MDEKRRATDGEELRNGAVDEAIGVALAGLVELEPWHQLFMALGEPLRRTSVQFRSLTKPAKEGVMVTVRSEEHTSELQSLTAISYAVFCLDRKSVV